MRNSIFWRNTFFPVAFFVLLRFVNLTKYKSKIKYSVGGAFFHTAHVYVQILTKKKKKEMKKERERPSKILIIYLCMKFCSQTSARCWTYIIYARFSCIYYYCRVILVYLFCINQSNIHIRNWYCQLKAMNWAPRLETKFRYNTNDK